MAHTREISMKENMDNMNGQHDLSKPPSNCPSCNGEREWTATPSGKPVAACFFCGKAEMVKAEGHPRITVAAFGLKEDRSHGFVVTANLGGNHCVRIHVMKTRSDGLAGAPAGTTVSWPSIGSTTADSARTVAEALVKAANLADRLEKASD